MPALSAPEVRRVRIDPAAALRWAVRRGLNEGVRNRFGMDIGEGRFLVNPAGRRRSSAKTRPPAVPPCSVASGAHSCRGCA